MENLNRYVSSRGLLKSCSAYNNNPSSSSTFIDYSIIERLPPYGSIYICTDALLNFYSYILKNIHHPFTLVTGDSDYSVSKELLSNEIFEDLINNPLLLNWFAQNANIKHPKIQHLPIGNDYHTMYEKPGLWELNQYTAINQENKLINIFSNAIDFENRFNIAYCNWHFSINNGNRHECLNELDKSICYFENYPLPRFASWERQSKFKFVISPAGVGIDCHRTWESLFLGCIPIIKSSSIDILFKDLPVLIVDNWSDINRDKLNLFLESLPDKIFNFDSLYLTYWTSKIKGSNPASSLVSSFSDYRNKIT